MTLANTPLQEAALLSCSIGTDLLPLQTIVNGLQDLPGLFGDFPCDLDSGSATWGTRGLLTTKAVAPPLPLRLLQYTATHIPHLPAIRLLHKQTFQFVTQQFASWGLPLGNFVLRCLHFHPSTTAKHKLHIDSSVFTLKLGDVVAGEVHVDLNAWWGNLAAYKTIQEAVGRAEIRPHPHTGYLWGPTDNYAIVAFAVPPRNFDLGGGFLYQMLLNEQGPRPS